MSRAPEIIDYASRPPPRPPLQTPAAIRFIGWRMLTAIFIAGLVAAIWFTLSPVLAIFSPVLVIVFFPELAGMTSRLRQQRVTMVLSYVEQAVRLNLPLPRMLDAAQRSEEKVTAKRLRRLRDLLEDGAPLAMALPMAVPEIPGRVASLIGAAERVGQLPQALDRLVGENRQTPEEAEGGTFARWYPLLMTLVMMLLVTLIMVFVMPRIEYIFHGFGMRLPRATRLLTGIYRDVLDGDAHWGLIAVVLFVLTVLGGMFERIWTPPADPPPRGWIDRIAWSLPLLHGALRDRGMADACYTTAAGLRGGRPLERAVSEASRVRMNGVLRNRWLMWQGALAAGQPADQAARSVKLPPLFCGMLGPGRGTDLPAAMEFLASYYNSRFSRGLELLRGAAIPLMVLFFAGIVLFMAAGMYLPLIEMIDHLNDGVLKVSK